MIIWGSKKRILRLTATQNWTHSNLAYRKGSAFGKLMPSVIRPETSRFRLWRRTRPLHQAATLLPMIQKGLLALPDSKQLPGPLAWSPGRKGKARGWLCKCSPSTTVSGTALTSLGRHNLHWAFQLFHNDPKVRKQKKSELANTDRKKTWKIEKTI